MKSPLTSSTRQLADGVRFLATLCLKERAKFVGPSFLVIRVLLKPELQHSLNSPLRFRPRQRGLKGGDGVEEPVGGRQRNLVDETLRGGDGAPIEGGNSARERIDEAVQLGVWKRPVDVSVPFRRVAVEVVRAENDFERAAAADQMWEAFGAAAAGMHSTPTSGWPSRVFSRDAKRMSQARTNSLLPPRTQPRIFAILTTGDFVRRTNVSIRIGRPEGPTAVVMFPVLPVKSKWAR